MARNPTTVAELIALWGSAECFARDVGLKRPEHARTMRARGSLNERWWDAVVLAASRRGIDGVSHRVLAQINARHVERTRASRRAVIAEPHGAAA